MKYLSIILIIFLTMATQAQDNGHYANVNGIRMYYEIHGDGQPLVLIHGGGSTITTTYGTVLPYFSKNYKVIAVELQAHGHTSDREAQLTFEQDADDIAELIRQLNIKKASFLGFSNGGSTVMQVGIRHPEIVEKLVIVSAMFKREGIYPWLWDMLRGATLDNMPQQLKDEFLKINPDTAALLRMHDKDCDRMLNFKDWKDDDIRSIKAPALVVDGDADVVTPEHAVEIYRLLPKGKLAILPGLHGEFLGEMTTMKKGSKVPELFVALVEEFLQNRD
jgi:pimeloyl-ACP methyl ester carboxylesterase